MHVRCQLCGYDYMLTDSGSFRFGATVWTSATAFSPPHNYEMLAESTVNASFRFFAVFSGSTSENRVSLLAVTKCSIFRMNGGTYDSTSFTFGGIDRQPFTKRSAVGQQL